MSRKLTLAAAVDLYLAEMGVQVAAGTLSSATLANRAADLPNLVRLLGAETSVKQIQAKKPLEGRDTGVYLSPVFTAYVAEKPGRTGAHDRFAKSVSAFFSWLVVEGVLPANPVKSCPTKPGTHRTIKANRRAVEGAKAQTFMTDEATKAGLRSWKSPQLVARNRAIVAVLIHSGLRVAELCDAQVSALRQREDGSWWIVVEAGKGDKERQVPVPSKVAELVHDYHAKRAHRSSYLFTSLRGAPLDRGAVGDVVRDVSGGRLTPHGCRHTAATLLIKRMSIHQVAKVLGHASITTTQGYLDVFDADLAAAVDDTLAA